MKRLLKKFIRKAKKKIKIKKDQDSISFRITFKKVDLNILKTVKLWFQK